jgi:hypothetical protein
MSLKTKNLLYFRIKSLIMKQEQVTLYSNDGTLVLGNGNNGVFSMLHSSGQLPNNTLQIHKYIKDSQI